MSRSHRMGLLTALFVVASAVFVASSPAVVKAVTICEQYGTTTTGNYVIMNNRWGTTATQCINTTSSGFSIIQQDGTGNLSGAPVSYPAIYIGCHYSNCSPNSPLPRQISQIGSANTSVSLTLTSSGTYDAAYDIWLNADTNVSGVQDTEIMIWLHYQGSVQPIGSQVGTINLAGRSWQVWVGNNGQNNVVSYRASGNSSFSADAMVFIRDAITRGSNFGNSSWYLTSMQMGFEPWIGGVGLAVNNFSASISGGTPPPPTRTPTIRPSSSASRTPTIRPSASRTPTPRPSTTVPPSGGTARCSASLRIDNSWGSGFTATATVNNTGTVATKSWTVTWTWPGSQTFTNSWNAAITQSGTAVTARNLSYNGAIGAGGNTTFGMQVNGSSATPTLTCSAT